MVQNYEAFSSCAIVVRAGAAVLVRLSWVVLEVDMH